MWGAFFILEGVPIVFLFHVPQILIRGLRQNGAECSEYEAPMWTSENANIPAFYRFHAVLVKGMGVFLTTVLATVRCGIHGNNASKE